MLKGKTLGVLGAAFLGLGLFGANAEAGHYRRYPTHSHYRRAYVAPAPVVYHRPVYHRPVCSPYYPTYGCYAPAYRTYPVVRHYAAPAYYPAYYPRTSFGFGYAGSDGYVSFGWSD